MKFILKKKLKHGTKEILKIFNLCLISFGFIIAIVLIKYRPVYEVKISDTSVGYIQNKKAFEEIIEEEPKLELKLVNKTQETNESEVTIALQKELKITYEYYEIALNNEVLATVDTMEEAQEIVAEANDEKLTITEKNTENIEEVNTTTLDVAKSTVMKTEETTEETSIANINGVKIASVPVTGVISSRYGSVSSLRVSTHTGLDIAAPYGTAIKAVADGTVTFAAYSGSYGYLVKIDHGNGVETWYGHTSKMYVKAGEKVNAGDTIAAVGSTGNSTGNHLHLEIRINGKHVNPQKYLY